MKVNDLKIFSASLTHCAHQVTHLYFTRLLVELRSRSISLEPSFPVGPLYRFIKAETLRWVELCHDLHSLQNHGPLLTPCNKTRNVQTRLELLLPLYQELSGSCTQHTGEDSRKSPSHCRNTHLSKQQQLRYDSRKAEYRKHSNTLTSTLFSSTFLNKVNR